MVKLFNEANELSIQKDTKGISFEDVTNFTNIFFALYVIFDRLALEIALDYLKNDENELSIYKRYGQRDVSVSNNKFHTNKDRYFFDQIEKGNLNKELLEETLKQHTLVSSLISTLPGKCNKKGQIKLYCFQIL